MSDIKYSTEPYSLVTIPNSEYERLAKIRERQRRERKEKLYSYSSDKSLSL